MRDNGGGNCSGEVMAVSGTAATNLHGGAKGACKHVSTPTLKSAMNLRKSMYEAL
jgi:hypothetical protein